MNYNSRRVWAFAWKCASGKYDIRPIADTSKQDLIDLMVAAMGESWESLSRKGAVALQCTMKPILRIKRKGGVK